jgi:hypothetical protein
MNYKKSTVGEIIDSERQMILDGDKNYGEYFINASEFNNLLCNFIKSIDDIEKFIFVVFLSQIKKHHTLALFSAVRQHHIQASMNLRQVLEAGAWAGYAMGNKELEKFARSKSGLLDVPDNLRKAKNKWLENNFKTKSDEIKKLKDLINQSTAHSTIIYAFQNFKMNPIENPGFNTPFFDFDDEYKVKNDLWFVANIAQGLIDMFYGINLQYKVFRFVDDFDERFRELVDQNNRLKLEMMQNPRLDLLRKYFLLQFPYFGYAELVNRRHI